MNLTQLKSKFNITQKKSFSNIKELAHELGLMVTEARVKSGLTQHKLAKKMKTQQPSIARVENGGVLPSLDFLMKMAQALETKLISPKFEFLKDSDIKTTEISTTNVGYMNFLVPHKMSINQENKDFLSRVSAENRVRTSMLDANLIKIK